MTDIIPVKSVQDGGGNVTGLAEAQTGEKIGITHGGTGATTAAGARTNLGAAAAADVSSLTTTVGNKADRSAAQSFSGGQRASTTALVDGATITLDFSLNNNFSGTLGGNRTLGNPTNQVAGQSGVIWFRQDATGGRTLSFASDWVPVNGHSDSIDPAPNAWSAIVYEVRTPTKIWYSILRGA